MNTNSFFYYLTIFFQHSPQQFGIMSIPTLMLKKDGQVVEKAVGVHSKEQLRQMIDQYL